MEDHKRDHDDFQNTNEPSRKEHEQDQQSAGDELNTVQGTDSTAQAARPSYYYSYGPFKSVGSENVAGNAGTERPIQEEERDTVEMTAPRPVKPLAIGPEPMQNPYSAPNPNPLGQWEYNQKAKKKSSFVPIVSSFLAGMLVISGLMFASDRMNLFTSKEAISQSGGGSDSGVKVSANAGGGGTVNTAADVVRPNNIAQIADMASPAVVKIDTYVKQSSQRSQGGSIFDDPFFRQFFGDDGSSDDQQQQQQQKDSNGSLTPNGLGSGFIFDKSGYILTNQHVIADADQIEVTVQGFTKPFKAKLLGSSFDLDLAVLKIEGDKDFATLKLGKSNDLSIGDWVVAIGNPYGFDHTVTVGVLSSKERSIPIADGNKQRNYQHLLQTDASINPGNSGGPLINLNGEVIGINTAVSTQAQGIGFAIPTSTIDQVLDALIKNKEIPKEPAPFIGAELVNLTDVDSAWLKRLKLDNSDGALVKEVYFNSPAFEADLRQYDVIYGINGTKYKTKEELIAQIQKSKVGDTLTLNIIRSGKQKEIAVTVGDKNKFNDGQQ